MQTIMSFLPFLDINTLIYILIGLIIILVIWIIRIEMRLSKVLLGKNAKSLEDSITWLRSVADEFTKFRNESISYFKNVEARLKRSIQAVETVRFNPFKGTGSGGNQSFSTTFLNEKGDGVVISSMYSRDRVSVFSKPVKKFSSDFEMTNEEKNVVETAKSSIINK